MRQYIPTSTDLLHMAQSSSLSEICNVKVVDFVVILEGIDVNLCLPRSQMQFSAFKIREDSSEVKILNVGS